MTENHIPYKAGDSTVPSGRTIIWGSAWTRQCRQVNLISCSKFVLEYMMCGSGSCMPCEKEGFAVRRPRCTRPS